jgi:thymidylate synthase
MGAVIRVFIDEVIKPAGGELEEVIWTSTSMHLYDFDLDMVEGLIGKIPEHIRRYL